MHTKPKVGVKIHLIQRFRELCLTLVKLELFFIENTVDSEQMPSDEAV